jgi:hypothetical protein
VQTEKQQNSIALQRLTALWALGESGLGGWMHALKLPFTGIFVGGFAVACIALIAHYSRNNMRVLLQSLLLVLLVKFTVSPQSPIPAYVAVAFQGVIGAVFYRLIGNYAVASVLFAFVAMLESAAQKLIIMTLIFGKSLWEAIDAFFKGILKDFSLQETMPFSYWIISIYVGLYAAWGLILGFWLSGLPKRLEARTQDILLQYSQLPVVETDTAPEPKKKKGIKWFLPLVFLFIIAVFLFSDDINNYSKAGYIIVRTIAVVLFLFLVLNPLFKWILGKWLAKERTERQVAVAAMLQLQPELKKLLRPSWRMARAKHKGIARYPAFITNLIALTLHSIDK